MVRCKAWRKAMGLTRVQLAKAAGYSVQAIQIFERGYNYAGLPIKDRAWRRYRLVCAGMTRSAFNWEHGGGDEGQILSAARGDGGMAGARP